MKNGTRNWQALTAYHDPASGMYALYEPCVTTPGVTLRAVADKDGKQLRVDADFLKEHQIPQRTEGE